MSTPLVFVILLGKLLRKPCSAMSCFLLVALLSLGKREREREREREKERKREREREREREIKQHGFETV